MITFCTCCIPCSSFLLQPLYLHSLDQNDAFSTEEIIFIPVHSANYIAENVKHPARLMLAIPGQAHTYLHMDLPHVASWPIAAALHYLLSSHPLLTVQLQPTFEVRWWCGVVEPCQWRVGVREISAPPSHSRPDVCLEPGLVACLTHCLSGLEEKQPIKKKSELFYVSLSSWRSSVEDEVSSHAWREAGGAVWQEITGAADSSLSIEAAVCG